MTGTNAVVAGAVLWLRLAVARKPAAAGLTVVGPGRDGLVPGDGLPAAPLGLGVVVGRVALHRVAGGQCGREQGEDGVEAHRRRL